MSMILDCLLNFFLFYSFQIIGRCFADNSKPNTSVHTHKGSMLREEDSHCTSGFRLKSEYIKKNMLQVYIKGKVVPVL
jgi:hypothetical protein